MPLALESHLGPYEIVSLIGSGAMGEVYRARDKRLARDVALKIVSSRDANEETRRRFEAEARAVSALNHPNILTVHDVGREDDISFLVTELIEGQSLGQLLQRGELPMRKVLDYGIQIANGLAAAHDEGIVHRDLKPENIMITRDDRVKILDFGIAKVVEPDSVHTLNSSDTAPGLLIGTTAYMSPEQARGTRVSYFTDQFSLGLILFEMAIGYPAFRRDTGLGTLSAILTEDPPELTAGSMAFRWLVKRLLHKDPEHRYGSMHDVLRDLRHARAALGDTVKPEVAPAAIEPPRTAARSWRRITLTAVLIAAALGAGFAAGWRVRPLAGFTAHDFRPVATGSGLEVFPAWAPDGRTLAWSGEVDGRFQVFARTLGAYSPTQVTHDSADCLFPFWSPDGGRIFYIGRDGLYVVGATGGTPQRVLGGVVQAAISPDGDTFAVLRRAKGSDMLELAIGSLGGLRSVPGLSPAAAQILPWSYLRFSPDGKQVAAWLSFSDGTSGLWTMMPDGSDRRRQLDRVSNSPAAREFSWLPDSRKIVFTDGSGVAGGSHLWRADLRTGILEPLTSGTGTEVSPAVSLKGRSVAFTSAVLDYDIVTIRADGSMRRILATNRFEVSPSAGLGGRLVWVTDRNGRPEIWYRAEQNSPPRPIVTPESFPDGSTVLLADTALSPDGARLAFRRVAPGEEAIWISTLTGDAPVRLGREPENAFQRSPGWSPDGNEIVYSSVRGGRPVLVRTRVGGVGAPVVIAENSGISPRWSPEGDLIAAIGPGEGLSVLTPEGKVRRIIGSGKWLLHGWSADGTAIQGVRLGERVELVRVEVRSGAESVLATIPVDPATMTLGMVLGMEPMRGLTVSNDGSGLVTSIFDASADIWTLQR